jgi:phosphoesterase RecJ-like protein
MPETTTLDNGTLGRIRDHLMRGRSFLITSHARPDGDSIGSQVAMAYALRALGKQARIVNADAPPEHYLAFPGVSAIEVATRVEGDYDALVVMECSDLRRPGVEGLERHFIINIDHHVGNTSYGALNWLDESAAACGEMVMALVDSLTVPLTFEIATHVYLAILTDTGSFHHSNITPRTFDICRRAVEAGVNPSAMARGVFDSNSFGKLKLIGALLGSMHVEAGGQLAVLHLDEQTLAAAGCTYNDTEGIINLPLTAREIQAVVFFKVEDSRRVRVSLRSKGTVDVRAVAMAFGGGGHHNASGFTIEGPYKDVRDAVLDRTTRALDGLTRP